MTKTDKQPRGRWVKILLIASLAFNLVIVGLIVGATFGDHRGNRGLKAPHGIRPYVSAMTEEQRKEFHKRTRHSLSGSLKTLKKFRNGQKAVFDAITAIPYSEAALRAVLDQQRSDISAIMGQFQEELIISLAAMSDDERARYVARMKELRRNRWRKRRR